VSKERSKSFFRIHASPWSLLALSPAFVARCHLMSCRRCANESLKIIARVHHLDVPSRARPEELPL
jgi:hypothetical protein